MSESYEEQPRYVLVPADALSATALHALIEEFVTREGTDYGPREYSLSEKVQSVERQLASGEVVIAFDLERESATLVSKKELPTVTSALGAGGQAAMERRR